MAEFDEIAAKIKTAALPTSEALLSRLANLDLQVNYGDDGEKIIDLVIRIAADCIWASAAKEADRHRYKKAMEPIPKQLGEMVRDGKFSTEFRGYIAKFQKYYSEIS